MRLFKKRNKIKTKRHVSLDIHAKSKVEAEKLFFGAVWSKKDSFKSLLVVRENASFSVKSRFRIYSGAKVYVNSGASLKLGSGYINHNLNLSCFEKIEIGEQVTISENVTIRDSDNHIIVSENKESIKSQPVKIGDHVWVGINVTILKGVRLGNNVIVAAGSIVTKSFPDNVLIGGVPAKIIKENVQWK